MYRIAYHPGDRLLHLTLEGFWSAATLARFAAELLVRTAAIGRGGTIYGVLSDSSRFPVQSPLVAQGFSRIAARGAERHRGPTAIVVAGALNKMQAERTLGGARLRVFTDAVEARSWIVGELASPAT